MSSKWLLCSQQCPGKNAVILTKPGFAELSLNIAYLFSNHGHCSLKKPTVLLWSLEVWNGRRGRARSDTLRSGRERERTTTQFGAISCKGRPACAPEAALVAAPCSSTIAGIFVIQLHLCSKYIWSPDPTPSWGHSIEQDSSPALTDGEASIHTHKRSYAVSIILKC